MSRWNLMAPNAICVISFTLIEGFIRNRLTIITIVAADLPCGVEPNKLIAQFGTNFKQDLNTNVSVYSKRQSEALKIMTEAGWK